MRSIQPEPIIARQQPESATVCCFTEAIFEFFIINNSNFNIYLLSKSFREITLSVGINHLEGKFNYLTFL